MWVHQIEITNFLNLAPFKSYLFLIHILNNSLITEFKISFISLKILVQDFFTSGRFIILEGGGGGSNIFIRSRMRAFFIRGRNILFRISSGAYLEGICLPSGLIHHLHMPLMPNGWKTL